MNPILFEALKVRKKDILDMLIIILLKEMFIVLE